MGQFEQAGAALAAHCPLAADALHVVTEAAEVDRAESQVIPFGLTASMVRHGAGADEVVRAMLTLREAVMAVSGIDPETEPVPLVVGDPAVAALSLGVYLRGLLDRAARMTGANRAAVSMRTLAFLRAG
ncbi:MAG TPA: hypothetical protein VEI83_11860 [Acidimicrobiales bacterium]|nr:hypothetical protein [Acidimicrobiales bacterium]